MPRYKELWDRIFGKKEDCLWHTYGYCYKFYPTGYPDIKDRWVKCNEICKEFKRRK